MPDVKIEDSLIKPVSEPGIRPLRSLPLRPLIVALDYATEADAIAMAAQLDPNLCRIKVGKELFTRCGPSVVARLTEMGFHVFLDLKFHDIPNTVAKAVLAAAEAGVWMVNVHASGGRQMMLAAREALSVLPESQRPLLIAVTVLTSMSEPELQEMSVANSLNDQVLHLATMAAEAGMDGVVCSALEAAAIKAQVGNNFLTVTPGIRPSGASIGDQKRVMTPAEAITAGSDYLVVGRPITTAENPMQVVQAIQLELDSCR